MYSRNYNRKISDNSQLINKSVSEIRAIWTSRQEAQKSTIKYSLDIKDYSEWEKKYAEYISFSQAVLSLINQKGYSSKEFYKKAHIDRKLFSKLKTDYCYHPNKITAIKICFALELSYDETEFLLKKAGFALMNWDFFDLVISYCFKKEITDIDIVNEILIQLDEKSI